mgnify:CR=1 FL=1
MDFTFTQEQVLLRDSTRNLLTAEVTPSRLRKQWKSHGIADADLWRKMLDLGIVSATIPEELGGSGLNSVDFVLLAEECGYVALAEPVVHTALVVVPLLCELESDFARELLSGLVKGDHRIAVACPFTGLVEDADTSAFVLKFNSDKDLVACSVTGAELSSIRSIDPGRRVFGFKECEPGKVLIDNKRFEFFYELLINLMAFANAAQSLGLAQRMLDLAVSYTKNRYQFNKPIGSFQAVKHLLANVAIKLEFAKPSVYRAANSLLKCAPKKSLHVSHAKIAACEAASLAAKNSLQAHGAMGYTWEYDLHIFIKRSLVLSGTGGDLGFHKARLLDSLFSDDFQLGPTATFS